MQVAQDQIDQYWQRGWTVVENVFPPEEVDRVVALAMRVSQESLVSDPSGYRADRGEDGQVAPRKIMSPFFVDEQFARFVLSPRLRALLRAFLQDTPRLVSDQIFMKPPRFGSAKPYHQDNGYFFIHPDDQVITAWIALDDVDESNGCLRYIDGSHRGEILQHRAVPGEEYNLTPDQSQIDLSRESLALVRRGGVVFHHSKTLHTSHRNTSDRWRRAYATHWTVPGATCDSNVLAEGHCNKPGYQGLVEKYGR